MHAVKGEDFYHELGRRLRSAREDAGLTQLDVARMLQVADPTYSRYETGERRVPVEELRKLAFILGKSVSYFMNAEITEDERFFHNLSDLLPDDRDAVEVMIQHFRQKRNRLK